MSFSTNRVRVFGEPSETLDFRLLFEAIPGACMALWPDLTIAAVNDSYVAASMRPRDSLIGRNVFETFPDNPDDPTAAGVRNLKTSLDVVLSRLVPDAMPVQKYDIRLPDAQDGQFVERFWSPLNSPVLGADGDLLFIIHQVSDVTDFVHSKQDEINGVAAMGQRVQPAGRSEAEIVLRTRNTAESSRELKEDVMELERLYEEVLDLDRAKSQSFANITHELRSSLTLILASVEGMLSSGGLNPGSRAQVESIKRNGSVLLQRVEDLLDLTHRPLSTAGSANAAGDLASLPHSIEPTPAPGRARPLLLVIEEDPDTNEYLCDVLSSDYSVASALTGSLGLTKAKRLRPDLILCNPRLPEIDGDQILTTIRGDTVLEATPIVMVTADSDGATHTRLLELGANDSITKPVDLPELLARINNCLDAHLLTQDLRQREFEAHLRAEEEHRVSVRLQEALLPDRLVEHDAIEIAARYLPASDLIGGDWYDTFLWPDGRIGLVVGDVVGHGIEAAAAMARMRLTVGALAAQTGGQIEALLEALDATVNGPNGTDFATACCAVLDPDSGSLQYASAGHPPMLLIRPSGRTRWLEGGRSQPLVRSLDTERPSARTKLDPGSVVLMFTDGVVERRGESISFGLTRLAKAARKLASSDIGDGCDEVIRAMLTETNHRDDAVVLAVRYLGPSPKRPISLDKLN